MRVRVFIACSLDGFIAGPNDELDWLEGPEGTEDTFTPFFNQIGAMLMGRRTYDVVCGFEGVWPYRDTPIIVATNRPIERPRATVEAAQGTIEHLVERAKSKAGELDVYLDGGKVIGQALDAGLVDEITLTLIPIALGEGVKLFGKTERIHSLHLESHRSIGGGMVELVYTRSR